MSQQNINVQGATTKPTKAYFPYYSFTDALICTMAGINLEKRKWPGHLDLEYMLNHSQDDGVILKGCLSNDDILRIIHGIISLDVYETRELCRLIQLTGIKIQITHNNSLFTCASGATFSSNLFNEEYDIFENRLINLLKEEYEELCHSIKFQGYLLTDGSSPLEYNEVIFRRTTRNVELEAVVIDPLEWGFNDLPEDLLQEYINLILNEKARVVHIRYDVKCAGQIVAQAWSVETIIRPGIPARKWLDLSDIRYVANEARTKICEMAELFKSFM